MAPKAPPTMMPTGPSDRKPTGAQCDCASKKDEARDERRRRSDRGAHGAHVDEPSRYVGNVPNDTGLAALLSRPSVGSSIPAFSVLTGAPHPARIDAGERREG
jgi:hypothetical protein